MENIVYFYLKNHQHWVLFSIYSPEQYCFLTTASREHCLFWQMQLAQKINLNYQQVIPLSPAYKKIVDYTTI
jgi:hypothetical protein